MAAITKQQLIAINTIISKRGLSETKKQIMQEASGGRTSSSKELTYEEARALLEFLNADRTRQEESVDRMVKKLIAMAYDLGWITTTVHITPAGIKQKKDYSAVYEWVKKFGYLRKDLKAYKLNELPKLLSQFEQGPYQHYLKK